MSGRTPACEDAAAITARIAELRRERMQAIAGCHCPRTTTGEPMHNPLCPLGPAAPSQMQLTLEAMQRARARLRQAGVPIREIEGAAGPLLILPTQAKLSGRDIAELRALWTAQTEGACAKMKRRSCEDRRFGGGSDGQASETLAEDNRDSARQNQDRPLISEDGQPASRRVGLPRSRP